MNRKIVDCEKESAEYLELVFEGELEPDYSFGEYLMDNFHCENGEFWYESEDEEE